MTRRVWQSVWVGLGSNLGDPLAHLRAAIEGLKNIPDTRLLMTSAWYRNPPMGPVSQPDYINSVAGLLTVLSARQLLLELQALERAAGRDRAKSEPWGARELDLDILSYGQQRVDEPGLTIPHPGIAERNFVLFPLIDTAPGLLIPGVAPLGQLVKLHDRSTVQRLDE